MPVSQSHSSLQPRAADPLRGEIWRVHLDPTRGSELQKSRPCLVISSDSIRGLPVRTIVPISSWQEKFAPFPYCVKIESDGTNGLDNDSVANAVHIRSVSLDRFVRKYGRIAPSQMEEVIAAVKISIEAV